MIQKHRIYTNIGEDQYIKFEIKQDFDLLEVLSLKMSQRDVYTSLCADYGVVCGRLTVNNGFGVPNARVSIFIPLDDDDSDDPIISALYPYTDLTEKDEDGFRYNLLPARRQHSGHAATGTFPDQSDILNREEVLEVFEKYYKYTVRTNDAGDFMIWGVPLGQQTIVCDVDLSDIGCFSLRPDDFLRLGFGVDDFKNKYEFKASMDLDSLPQIKTFSKTIEVYPFWGNEDLCEIGITRTDFDLSDQGVKIEPKAYVIGGTYTEEGKKVINRNCSVPKNMGRKCDLKTKKGKIEAIRFKAEYDANDRPILELYETNEDIPEDGSFIIPIPMNMDFLYTNEFGENEYTNDPNKGIPTSACYRFRFSLLDTPTASYLAPNIREYPNYLNQPQSQSYAWSLSYKDYPSLAHSLILNKVDGFYVPQDYFYRFSYNKVYTVSSFHSAQYRTTGLSSNRIVGSKFVGIKDLVPNEQNECNDIAVTPPVNYGFRNFTFTLLIADVLLFLEQIGVSTGLIFNNTLAKIFHRFAAAVDFWPIKQLSKSIRKFAYGIQDGGQRDLYLIEYPTCLECNRDNEYGTTGGRAGDVSDYCVVGTAQVVGSSNETSRTLTVNSISFAVADPIICSGATAPTDVYFYNNQTEYYISHGVEGYTLDASTKFVSGATITFLDPNSIFPDSQTYTVEIRQKSAYVGTEEALQQLEEGCELFDVPYDESVVQLYYTNTGRTPTSPSINGTPTYTPGMNVQATLISDVNSRNYPLLLNYEGDSFIPLTPSGQSEFKNGIFTIIPGTLTTGRIVRIMREYRKRRKVAKMFCGGAVNYSFVDNWLSGSLYFPPFEIKRRKYCGNVVTKVTQTNIKTGAQEDIFYYKSTAYNDVTGVWGSTTYSTNRTLNRPTTFVDLGPRDEFIKEICVDPNLDPNCSVSRNIGPTTYKDFGELLGLAINYRLDVGPYTFDFNNFFDNNGYPYSGVGHKVLDGDILQLISINNEAGIEGFDLQNPKYIGYSYQILDPEIYPDIFKKGSVWGPLPITLDLDEDGERIRLCLNEPSHLANDGVTQVQGRLTESSQPVPFFLWDKKGTGFGAYNTSTLDDQSFSYTGVTVQPLQGMTYAYNLTGTTDDSSDKYLLLPITYDGDGLAISNLNVVDDEGEMFDSIVSGVTGNEYQQYNTEYPGYTVLVVTSGTLENPLTGTLWTRYSSAGTWHSLAWTSGTDFIIRKTRDYYSGTKQILSTPFLFYFGLKPGATGLDKFIERFGPKDAFKTTDDF